MTLKRTTGLSEERKRKIAESMSKRWQDPNYRQRQLGRAPWNKGLTADKDSRVLAGVRHPWWGRRHSEVDKKKESESHKKRFETHKPWNKGRSTDLKEKHYRKRILKEINLLQQQGFRCVPVHWKTPDIVAIKGDNLKIFAVEVSDGIFGMDIDKYPDELRRFYDDIVWIVYRGRKAFKTIHSLQGSRF